MSIQSEIDRINTNVQETISTIADTGVAVPANANSDDLPALAAALANEKADAEHTHEEHKVFVATAGETTYQEIMAAYNAGRVVQAIIGDEGLVLNLMGVNEEMCAFAMSVGILVIGLTVTSNNEWTMEENSVAEEEHTHPEYVYSAATISKDGLMSAADKSKLDYTNIAYGTCSTAAATAAKIIAVEGNTGWSLTKGSIIFVKFSETNTAQNPTFNVNGKGAKPVVYGTAAITTSSLSYAGYANRTAMYVYNGTQFVFQGWSVDSNSDTKATQAAAITTAGEYPVILGYSTATTAETNTLNKTTTLKYNPSTKVLTAPTFKGNLTGNADAATKATQDGNGNVIADTYATKNEVENFGLPAYWLTHIDERINDIHSAMASAGWNKSAFLWYHDSHWAVGWENNSKKAPAILKYLHRNTGINKTIYGGDIVNTEGDYDTTMDYLWEWRKMIRDLPNHHSVIGNHDDGVEVEARWSDETVYSWLLAPEETPDVVRLDYFNYYIDNPTEKTRYFYLDTAAYNHNVQWNADQLALVKEALKNTPANWHIVVIAHDWLEVNYDVSPPTVTGINYAGEVLFPIFDSYNLRDGEYSDCGAMVEFIMGGHSHVDGDYFTDSGIPVITTECEGYSVRSGLACTAGTITESSVNAIVADYNNMVVNVIRIGRGTSRTVPIERIVPPKYTNVIPLSVDKDGSAYNGGTGFKTDTRINSSQNDVACTGWCVTGYIAVKNGDVVRLKNVTWKVGAGADGYDRGNIFWFDSSKGFLVNGNTSALIGTSSAYVVTDSNGSITQFTVPASSGTTGGTVGFIRICCQSITADSVITINEEIV